MDKLIIKDLEVFANHGVFAEEKTLGQKFILSFELDLSMREAAVTGDLSKSVHYGELCAEIEREFQRESYDLIETAGEMLASYILEHYTMVECVKVIVKKPWAPIHKPLKYAAIEIKRGWHRAFISFGSNMGNKEENIKSGLELLYSDPSICSIKESSIIETEPWGYEDQDTFLNGVLEIETTYTPHELMTFLLKIELALKRERLLKWGPRTLDLDLLFYDRLIIDSPDLILPHPRIKDRLFVLDPLAEIAPFYIHPVTHQSMLELCERLKASNAMKSE
ncbi:MAG: 2-amino-4-hydroxy-6-hydroxymethyldihydropteridine diphosphokinase [Eubacterium sp.]